VAQVRNELARIKVDALNTIAHNEQLKVNKYLNVTCKKHLCGRVRHLCGKIR